MSVQLAADIGLTVRWDLSGVGLLALGEKLISVVPSYAVLLFLGMTQVSDCSNLALTILVTALGSTVGAICWYGLGRAIGPTRCAALVARYGRYVKLTSSRYEHLAWSYRRNRFGVTVIGQTIPLVRIFLPLPAGVLKLPVEGFMGATLLGALIWNTPLLSLGYLFRGTGHDPLHVGLIIVTALVTLEFSIGGVVRWVTHKRAAGMLRRGNEAQQKSRYCLRAQCYLISARGSVEPCALQSPLAFLSHECISKWRSRQELCSPWQSLVSLRPQGSLHVFLFYNRQGTSL